MKKLSLIIALLLLFLTLHPVASFAHRLVIEPKEAGSIKVVYEDGSYSTRTVVIVFDRQGNEIERGTLDSDGYFFYDEVLAHFFVADDSIGHRTEWTVGEDVVYKTDPHRWITAGVVSLILISIAVFFSYRSKRRLK